MKAEECPLAKADDKERQRSTEDSKEGSGHKVSREVEKMGKWKLDGITTGKSPRKAEIVVLAVLRVSGKLFFLMCLRSLVRKIDLIFPILKLFPMFIVPVCEEQICGNYN